MKKIIQYPFLAMLFLWIMACQPNDAVTPDFEVTVSQQALKKGEPVQFSFTGNPDFITFFPGTTGMSYDPAKPVNGTALKDLTVRLSTYSFTYQTAGSFTATFIGITNNVYGRSEVKKTIQLTIN